MNSLLDSPCIRYRGIDFFAISQRDADGILTSQEVTPGLQSTAVFETPAAEVTPRIDSYQLDGYDLSPVVKAFVEG